ncbi:MAG: DMT family transporter, partial [bacterium]|nr:DMT family transporter [bacterium]
VFMFLEKKGVAAGFRTGDLIILLAVIIWSTSAIYLKRIISTFVPFQLVLYSTLFSVPFFFLEALLWDGTMVSRLDAPVIGSLLYQSLITASFGFVAWNTMLKKYGAVSLHAFVFIMPIAGVGLGGLVLGEPITIKILLALAFIVSGILVVHWKSRDEVPVYPVRRS